MGDTGSFVVIYVDSGYFITGLDLDFDGAGLHTVSFRQYFEK